MKKPITRKCLNCKVKFEPFRSSQTVCQPRCAIEYSKQQKEKAEARKSAENKKVLKEKLKTLSEYEAEAKKSFQKFIRLRDHDQPCISCGKHNCTDWAGGHYFSAGMYSGLMFDERNCHKQCNTYCNKYLSGNLIEYRNGLINRHGEDFVKQLESDATIKRDYKYTKQELIAKKLQYDLKIKEFKHGKT